MTREAILLLTDAGVGTLHRLADQTRPADAGEHAGWRAGQVKLWHGLMRRIIRLCTRLRVESRVESNRDESLASLEPWTHR